MSGLKLSLVVATAAGLVTAVVSTLWLAASAAVLAGTVTGCLAVVPASRSNVRRSEAVARFAAILANQAAVAPTVTAALSRAAPLVGGEVGRHAELMVEECRELGVSVAARRFAERTDTPAAHWLGDVLGIAAASGARWVQIMTVLEREAATVAETARHFHRHVASAMTPLAVATLMGAGIVVGTSLTSSATWEWMLSSQGGMLALASSVGAALVALRLLRASGELLR